MKKVLHRYRHHLSQAEYRRSLCISVAVFVASILVSYYVIGYATRTASNSVTDIVLSNLAVYNVDGFFVYGTLVEVAFITLLAALHPRRIPFMLYALATFWLIRSVFTSLTHVGPFPVQAPFDLSIDLGSFVLRFFTGNDLFFSAHVGSAFLMMLLFWEERPLRYAFIAWSAYFSVIVLLGHYHYSIDVFSAYFITYGIFHLTRWLFPRDYAAFKQEA